MVTHTESLINLIVNQISESPQQRITFADYMNLVLYHPQYGYYASGTVKIGSQGDFFTSSSLGSDFAELLAEQFLEMWEILGNPNPFMLVEMGAGSGIFAEDVLQYLSENYSDFLNVIEYIIVEESEGLIAHQKKILEKWLDKSTNLCWKSWQQIQENSLVGCLFSNELVDAFPGHQLVIKSGQLQEIYLTIAEGKFQEVTDNISTDKLQEYFNLVGIDLPSPAYPEGYRTEVNLAALDWLGKVAKRLQRGYLLTIDYGYTAQRYYHPQRHQGTLQCYFQHHRHPNPYSNIGQQDITTHVDFTALESQGKLLGLEPLGFTQQGIFLMALGLGNRLANLSQSQLTLPQLLQRRDALHQLINPAGLGNFGVLVQTKGLTEEESGRYLKGLTWVRLF
jgi:SAM-dependent MidA family methyltransferase